MAWIERDGKRRRVRWVTYDDQGQEVTHSSGRLTEPKAKALKAKLNAKLPDRRRRKPGLRLDTLSIAKICEEWKAAKVAEEPQSANYAAEAVARAEAIAEEAGILTIEQATAKRVRDLRKNNPHADRPLAYLRSIISWAADEHGLEIEPRFYVASRPKQSQESEARLATEQEIAAIEAKAKALSQWPLVHCLLRYGWRPITACRITVGDVDLVGKRIRLRIKHKKKPHYHPLFPDSIELLRPLLVDAEGKPRPAEDRLFLSPTGKPWPIYGDEAKRLVSWWIYHMQPLSPGTGGTNCAKRWAVHCMERGLAPWPRMLTIRETRLFTGHSTDSQVIRYRRVSAPEATALVQGGSGVEVMQLHAKIGNAVVQIMADMAATPDESMSFST